MNMQRGLSSIDNKICMFKGSKEIVRCKYMRLNYYSKYVPIDRWLMLNEN